jgi:hypothetical protein
MSRGAQIELNDASLLGLCNKQFAVNEINRAKGIFAFVFYQVAAARPIFPGAGARKR